MGVAPSLAPHGHVQALPAAVAVFFAGVRQLGRRFGLAQVSLQETQVGDLLARQELHQGVP